MKKSLKAWSALALLVVASACQKASPARPSEDGVMGQTTSMTDATTGITLTSPALTAPALNKQFKNVEQPVTLTFRNAVTTGSTALTYTVDVSTDVAFASKAYTKTAIAGGANNSTSITIDKLTPDKTYFWRARASSGSVDGPYTAPGSFAIGPEVILQTPTRGDPQANATVGESPVINVNNVTRTGPAGTITYKFDISTAASFSPITYTATVTERTDLPYTPHTVTSKLPEGTYFWRVTASDVSNAVTTAASSTGQFKVLVFNMATAIIVNSPPDLGRWPETTRITRVDFGGGAFQVDFDRRQGPGKWPEVVPAGWDGGIQYTLGMCVNINGAGQWYCSAVVQFWDGRSLADSAPPENVGFEWFYDPVRWREMHNYQPRSGETVGIFVGSGNLRDGPNFTQASCPRICERSNVEMVIWP